MRRRAGNRETGSTTSTICARESRVYSNFGGLSKGGFLGVFRCVHGDSRRLQKVFMMFQFFYIGVYEVSMFLQKFPGCFYVSTEVYRSHAVFTLLGAGWPSASA